MENVCLLATFINQSALKEGQAREASFVVEDGLFNGVGVGLELNLGNLSQWELRLRNSQASVDLQNLSSGFLALMELIKSFCSQIHLFMYQKGRLDRAKSQNQAPSNSG